MATEFVMPKLGLTMEEGTIVEWLVADGSEVRAGAGVLRIETDKTETDVEAAAPGRLHVVGTVGETYACGELIGWFLAEGEDPPASLEAPMPRRSPGERVFASPNARRIAAERGLDLDVIRGTGPNGRIVSEDLDGHAAAAASERPARPMASAATSTGAIVPATAAARQLADLLGVDLATVPPDPVDRRVTRDAVALHVRALLAGGNSPAQQPSERVLPATQTPSKVIALSGMRGTIASRMHGSLQQMAQLTLFMDADLDAVVADRNARRATGAGPSYTDYIVAAVARALVEHPRVNSQVTDDGIAVLPEVHVGVAVALDEGSDEGLGKGLDEGLDEGLIVPVVRNTATLDLAALSAETSRLADGARSRSLAFADLEGGTFSVSTLGMFGVDGFTPVINPPNTAILGVGRLRDDVVADGDGGVATVTRVTLSLTWDHRAFDGAPAAAFTRTVCELLQRPADLDATS